MQPVKRIRVLVVDDHEFVRRGLAVFLRASDEFKLIGEASNGAEAVQLCGELLPDVVLMDLKMPEMDGVAATHAIRQAYPDVRVVGLTSSSNTDMVQAALQAGACGCLIKTASIDELAGAIRMAAAGQSFPGTAAGRHS